MTKIFYKPEHPLTKKFRELRKTKSTKEIAKENGLSGERVRTIILGNKIEDIAKTTYFNFKKKVEKMTLPQLLETAEELRENCRRQDVVIQRDLVIKRLRDEFKFSFPALGKLFKRDHTTIIHAYNKKYE